MMKRILIILFWISIPFLVWAGLRIDAYWNKVTVGSPVSITNDIGKPYAVLTIDYGEPPEGFIEGEFYVLKCLKIRATKIDYGFCPVKRNDYYKLEK